MNVIGAFIVLVAASFTALAEPAHFQPKVPNAPKARHAGNTPQAPHAPETPPTFEFDLQFSCANRAALEMARVWPRIASLCAAEVPGGGTVHCQSSRASEFGKIHFISKKCSLLLKETNPTETNRFCVEKIVVKEAADQPVLCVEPAGVTFEKLSETAFLAADQELFKSLASTLQRHGCELNGEAENKVIAPDSKLQQTSYTRRFFWPSPNCFLKNGAADCGSERYEARPFQVEGFSGERVLCRLKEMRAKGPPEAQARPQKTTVK